MHGGNPMQGAVCAPQSVVCKKSTPLLFRLLFYAINLSCLCTWCVNRQPRSASSHISPSSANATHFKCASVFDPWGYVEHKVGFIIINIAYKAFVSGLAAQCTHTPRMRRCACTTDSTQNLPYAEQCMTRCTLLMQPLTFGRLSRKQIDENVIHCNRPRSTQGAHSPHAQTSQF